MSVCSWSVYSANRFFISCAPLFNFKFNNFWLIFKFEFFFFVDTFGTILPERIYPRDTEPSSRSLILLFYICDSRNLIYHKFHHSNNIVDSSTPAQDNKTIEFLEEICKIVLIVRRQSRSGFTKNI